MLNKFFKLKENNTDIKTEVIAGITTFLAMSYILGVNPGMLSQTGMSLEGVFIATALASGIACIIMGILANYPVGLSAGMGLNAIFTYTIVLDMGLSWNAALQPYFYLKNARIPRLLKSRMNRSFGCTSKNTYF